MKKSFVLFGFFVLAVAVAPMYGQGGCLNSPENPTVVLALVGSAGAFTASVRARMRSRRKLTQK